MKTLFTSNRIQNPFIKKLMVVVMILMITLPAFSKTGRTYGNSTPPTVSIINPVFSMTYTSPATVALEASAASDSNGIAQVDFYANSTLIGTAGKSPWVLNWANMPLGTYSITAVATDSAGLSTTSAPVSITIASGGYTFIFDFISFSATMTYPQVSLAWLTSNASNTAYFEVQRSADSLTFTDIDTVFYQLLSTDTLYYAYKDVNPLLGNNYYRIKRVSDLNDSTFTSVILINNPGGVGGFVWSGRNSTNWSNRANWTGGVVPDSRNANVNILAPVHNSYQPEISPGVTITVRNLTIAKNAILTNKGTLRITGRLINKGKLISTSGKIIFAGVTPQTIPQNAFEGSIQSFSVENKTGLKIEGDVPVSNQPRIYTSLYFNDAQKGRVNADGSVALYDNSYSINGNGNPALKMASSNEQFGLFRNKTPMSIDTRPLITKADTLFLSMQHMRQQSYEWQINPSNWNQGVSSTHLVAALVDNYMGTRTSIDLASPNTSISFDVTSDKGSYAADRFYIVISPDGVLPVSLQSFTATQQGMGVNIDWTVTQQNNMRPYEILRAQSGINLNSFTTIGTVAAQRMPGVVSYTFFDANPYPGLNYYRIKMTDKEGKATFSPIIKVYVGIMPGVISVYPNPVTGNSATLQLNNLEKGKYQVMLMNNAGQVVYTKEINHNGGSATQAIQFDRQIAPGAYHMIVSGDAGKFSTQIFKQ